MITSVSDGDLLQSLKDVHVAIKEALVSTARPTAAGVEYLRGLRAEAAALGAEVERRQRNISEGRNNVRYAHAPHLSRT